MKYYFNNVNLLFTVTHLELRHFNDLLNSQYESLIKLLDIGSFSDILSLKTTKVEHISGKKLLVVDHNNYISRINVLKNFMLYGKKGGLVEKDDIQRYINLIGSCDLFIPIHNYSVTNEYLNILSYKIRELNEIGKIMINTIYLFDVSFLFIKEYNIVMKLFNENEKKLINIDKITNKMSEDKLISSLIGNYCVSESRGQRANIWRGRNVYCYLFGIPLIYENINDIGKNFIFSKQYVLSKNYDEIVNEQKQYFENLFSHKLIKIIKL